MGIFCLSKLFRLQKLSDEYLEKKVDFNRELALSKQQVIFLVKEEVAYNLIE